MGESICVAACALSLCVGTSQPGVDLAFASVLACVMDEMALRCVALPRLRGVRSQLVCVCATVCVCVCTSSLDFMLELFWHVHLGTSTGMHA